MFSKSCQRFYLALSLSVLGTTMSPVMIHAMEPQTGSHSAHHVLKGHMTYQQQVFGADYTLQTGQYQAAETLNTKLLQKDPKNLKYRSALSLSQASLFK